MSVFILLVTALLAHEAWAAPRATLFVRNITTTQTAFFVAPTLQPPEPTPLPATVISSIMTSNSTIPVIVNNQTFIPSSPSFTISGTQYSVSNDGVAFTSALDPTPLQIQFGPLTLQAGGPDIMVSGTILSLDPSGSSLVIGGTTTEALDAYLATIRLQTTLSVVVNGTGTLSAISSTQTSTTSSATGLGGIVVSVGGFATPTPSPPTLTSIQTSTSASLQTSSFSTESTSNQVINQPTDNISAHATASSTDPSPSGSTSCGEGLAVCLVEDPTRLEAPWHGASAAFPQCYDPTTFQCAENFLCPINAPKIEGAYACGPLGT